MEDSHFTCFMSNSDLSDIKFLVIPIIPFSSLSFLASPSLFLETGD